MTYTSIAILVILGDDLTRLDRKSIIEGKWKNVTSKFWLHNIILFKGVAAVQRPDGSFSASVEGNEYDMRFVYCAACICFMLNDWGQVNKSSMGRYIMDSIVSSTKTFKWRKVKPFFIQKRFDGGVSQHFEMESHGGTTFCALAALQLSDQMHLLNGKKLEKMKRWLLFRQDGGFQGRPNKPIDTW